MCKAAYKRLVFKKDAVCKILDDLRTDFIIKRRLLDSTKLLTIILISIVIKQAVKRAAVVFMDKIW